MDRNCAVPWILLIPADMTPTIIGPKGATIGEIQTKSNCRIDVDKNRRQFESRRSGAVKEVVLSGDMSACKIACLEIQKILDSDELVFAIPPESTTLVVGAKGVNVNRIQDEFNIKCQIARAKPGLIPGEVRMNQGQMEDMVEAAADMYDLISRDNFHGAGKGGGGGGGGKGGKGGKGKWGMEDPWEGGYGGYGGYGGEKGYWPPPPSWMGKGVDKGWSKGGWGESDAYGYGGGKGAAPQKKKGNPDDLVLVVDSESSGAFIGSGGVIAREIQDESGINMDVEKGFSPQKEVRLRGDSEQKRIAVGKLVEIMVEKDLLTSNGIAVGFPPEFSRQIVGAQGSTVRQIEDTTGCRVDIDKNNSGVCYISHPSLSIEALVDAAMEVDSVVVNAVKQQGGGGGGGVGGGKGGDWGNGTQYSHKRPMEGGHDSYGGAPAAKHYRSDNQAIASVERNISMVVAAQSTSILVGPGGRFVNYVQSESGARVDVGKEGGEHKVVTVSGPPQSKRIAVDLMLRHLQDNDMLSGQIQIMIPPESVTLVVGGRGANIKRMQEATGSTIDVAKEGQGPRGAVIVSGSLPSIVEGILSIDHIVCTDGMAGSGY